MAQELSIELSTEDLWERVAEFRAKVEGQLSDINFPQYFVAFFGLTLIVTMLLTYPKDDSDAALQNQMPKW